MGIISMIVIGLIVGAIAKLLMPGDDPGGIIVTILLGIGGSVLAGFLGRALGWYTPGEHAGTIASSIESVLLLALYRLIVGRGRSGAGGVRRAAERSAACPISLTKPIASLERNDGFLVLADPSESRCGRAFQGTG